jgi:hypothetical protein
MTSILAAQPVTFLSNNIAAQMDTPQMPQMSDPALEHQPKSEEDDKNRGRHRSRINKRQEETGEPSPDEADGEGDGADGPSSGNDGPSRKRRRSRKGLDKKFECPQEGCGKSYSRAEHLSATLFSPFR